MKRIRTIGVGLLLSVIPLAMTAHAAPKATSSRQAVLMVPNTFSFWDQRRFWTTSNGPAYADILLKGENFLPCKGGPIALCYYSGPTPQTCVPTADGRFANCECFEIPYGPYFVDINAILNHGEYLKTVRQCGADGKACAGSINTNKAPVCDSINQGKLIPGADLISTFSFACVPEESIGQTNCPADPNETAPYAGCMTAACSRSAVDGIVNCLCPTFDGRFQVGTSGASCDLGPGLVWSAAYNPQVDGKTFPTPPTGDCFPDAAGEFGCPLYKCATTDQATCSPGNPPQMLPPGSRVNCTRVCDEYRRCANKQGVQIGFTCDATLCTSTSCQDMDLVTEACTGLGQCEVPEILVAEAEAHCSCCASQLCGCTPDDATKGALTQLNEEQTARGLQTQCALNGTLCGNFQP